MSHKLPCEILMDVEDRDPPEPTDYEWAVLQIELCRVRALLERLKAALREK